MDTFEAYSKLLANENLSVVYSAKADTASFDLETKVITLPMLEFLGKVENQAMTAHEVGHALYSKYPLDVFSEHVKNFGSLFNIIEDIYIEASIKKEYPGLIQIFKNAYRGLNDADFFSLKGKDVSKLHFFDRLNIYFKIGHCVNVKFSQDELPFVSKCYQLKSNEDVVNLCDELKKFAEDDTQIKLDTVVSQNSGSSSSSYSSSSQSQNSGSSSSSSNSAPGETYESFEKNLKRAISENREAVSEKMNEIKPRDDCYIFDISVSTYDNPMDYICENISEELNDIYQKVMKYRSSKSKELKDIFSIIDSDLEAVKRVANDGNVYFQTLKNAKRMRNAKRKLTGNIDFRRLAQYRTSENIFKIKQLKDKEQSHGVTILIDYSGSMHKIINQVLFQALLTCEFCKRNNIFFNVYVFGAEPRLSYKADYKPVMKIADSNNYNPDAIYVTLSNYYNEIRSLVKRYYCDPELSHIGYSCGVTPLFPAAIVGWHSIAEQKRLGYDKTHCIIISDGDDSNWFEVKYTISSIQKRLEDAMMSNKNLTKAAILHFMYNDKRPCYVYVNGIPYEGKPNRTIVNTAIYGILKNAKELFGTEFTFSYLIDEDRAFYYDAYDSFIGERVCSKIGRNKLKIEGITVYEPDEDSFADSFVLWKYSSENENFNSERVKKKYSTTTKKINKYLQKKQEKEKDLSIFITELAKNIA